jgi:hypothetical protein
MWRGSDLNSMTFKNTLLPLLLVQTIDLLWTVTETRGAFVIQRLKPYGIIETAFPREKAIRSTSSFLNIENRQRSI